MHTFLDNIQEDGKLYAQIVSHKAELRKEEKIVDQKSSSISDLQIDHLNLNNSIRNNKREHFDQSRYSNCGISHPTGKYF